MIVLVVRGLYNVGNMATNTNYDLKLFGSLLVPSMISGVLCVLAGLFIVGAIAVLTNYQGSSFQRELQHTQVRSENEAIGEDYEYISEDFEQNAVLDRAPVMVFWMFVGTLVYFLVTGIAGAIANVNEIGQELHYMHVRRKQLLKEVYIKSALRFCVLGIWLGFIILFFRVLLPYCLAAAHVGAGSIATVSGSAYILLALIVLVICLHIHVVMLRLVVLRPRIFSQELSF